MKFALVYHITALLPITLPNDFNSILSLLARLQLTILPSPETEFCITSRPRTLGRDNRRRHERQERLAPLKDKID